MITRFDEQLNDLNLWLFNLLAEIIDREMYPVCVS